MKKRLKTILVTSMVVCFSFLMFACGSSNLVDVSGNYNSMTDADVQKFEVCETNWTKQQVISMEFKYSTSFTLDNGESAEMTASGMLDSLGNMSFEAHIIENTDTAKTDTKISEAYLDNTNGLVYLNNKYAKVCEKLSGSYYEGMPEVLSYDRIQDLFDEGAQNVQIATKGGYTKFKYETQIESFISGYAYLVFDSNNNFYGYSSQSTMYMGNGTQTVNFELRVCDKAVEFPEDLDSYNKLFA